MAEPMLPHSRGGEEEIRSGRKGSVLADRHARGLLPAPAGAQKAGAYARLRFPTNEEVVKAVQERIQKTVDLCRSYRHAVWYMAFVGAYMAVLYFQASSFQAESVVATMRRALLDDPTTSALSFSSSDQVLAYLGNKVVRPSWTDPVCGDGTCEAPWEFPAWGPFGCRADCGLQPAVSPVVVVVTADFTGHASLSPRALMARVSWNLCMSDAERRKRGEPDLCWFDNDQVFSQYQETQIQSVSLVDGAWHVRINGDFAGRVSGGIYNATDGDNLMQLATEPVWDSCLARQKAATAAAAAAAAAGGAATRAARRLQEAMGRLSEVAGEEGARDLVHRALIEAAARHISSSGGAARSRGTEGGSAGANSGARAEASSGGDTQAPRGASG